MHIKDKVQNLNLYFIFTADTKDQAFYLKDMCLKKAVIQTVKAMHIVIEANQCINI
jgi:hypothetical protein